MSKNKQTNLLRIAARNFIFTSGLLLVLTAVALFIYTRVLLDNEIEEELYSKTDFVANSLNENTAPYSIEPIIEAKRVSRLAPDKLKDTVIYDPRQNEKEVFKELTVTKKKDFGIYEIKVRSLVIESDDIYTGIVISFLSILTLTSLILFFINKSKNKKLWAPFFESIQKLKAFSFDTKKEVSFSNSNIREFNELNNSLNALIQKITHDYNNLKQFTEDVSHEAQTPLSIIQAKIENLINENGLSETQYEQLNSLQTDTRRLAQLNKRLILLAKIENQQFTTLDSIDLKNFIDERVEHFKELSQNSFTVEVNPKSTVKMDMYLAEVLLDNLIGNAIKYSDPTSNIHIKASGLLLEISNTGGSKLLHPEKVFERYYREGKKINSSGLGLSLVRKICNQYDFTPTYSFRESEHRHIFTIQFN